MGKAGKEKGPVSTIAVFSVRSGYFYSFMLKKYDQKQFVEEKGLKGLISGYN